jgi:DNA-binding transcriptional regulator YdaS (Cro superfamily)
MQVDKTLEAELHVEAPSDVLDTSVPTRRSSQKSILALSVFALGLNAAAAVYTVSPSDFALPDVSVLAELLPHQKASEPKPDPVVAALDDIQSIQQRHVSLLQETTSSLQQNASLLQQDSIALASLRQSVTDGQVDVKKISAQIADEHVDVKKISTQISSLIAKVDSLQNALSPEFTSSIPTGHGRNRLFSRKRMARQGKPLGPVSVGGAPLSIPVVASGPQG